MTNLTHTVNNPLAAPNAVFPTKTCSLIDTHTHFDDAVFDNDRLVLAQSAHQSGIEHLVLIGYLAKYFDRMTTVYGQMRDGQFNQASLLHSVPTPHLAFGLHPAYIAAHTQADLDTVAQMLTKYSTIAIGEIGLDTYTEALKTAESLAKQTYFFKAQLDLAVSHNLPVLLHIRKAHAQCLAVLKAHDYDAHQLGGIAHSFSGGIQEAKAFITLGFKLGVTGQVSNPNAKKLRRTLTQAVAQYGVDCLVLETDCPDMTPLSCQQSASQHSLSQDSASQDISSQDSLSQSSHTRNVPQNLVAVLQALSELLDIEPKILAAKLWQNSCDALRVDWQYLG